MEVRPFQIWVLIVLLLGGLAAGLARAGGICCQTGSAVPSAAAAAQDGCCEREDGPRPAPAEHEDNCPPDGQCPRACCAGVVMGDLAREAPAPALVCVGLAEQSPRGIAPCRRDDDLLRPPRA